MAANQDELLATMPGAARPIPGCRPSPNWTTCRRWVWLPACGCCRHARPISSLANQEALAVLAEVHAAVAIWREVALGLEVGLRMHEREDFAPALEHEQIAETAALPR